MPHFSSLKNFKGRIRYKPPYLLVMFGLIMLVVGTINYAALIYSQNKIIEHEAVRIAEIVANQALSSRTAFSMTAEKLKKDGFGTRTDFIAHIGFVPIPAQFLKFAAQEASRSNENLYTYFPISKWNLEPNQGLKDDFERFAWKQLEKQDQANPTAPIKWEPVWRFETMKGIKTLRYMRADPAAKPNCVECHNQLEKTSGIIARRLHQRIPLGKQWKQHQLLGAIEVNIPVNKVEALATSQSRMILLVILLTSIAGFTLAAWLAIRDILKERSAAEHFKQKSNFDSLTQLANRTLFDELATQALMRATIRNTRVSILFIDLDHFKPINDTYGHHVGDSVLQEVGKRLTQSLRSTDIVARQGGDEFLVLLEGGAVFSPLVTAQKLIDNLKQPIYVEDKELCISASIGISRYPEHGDTLAQLIDKADTAMYKAKKDGKDGYFVWNEESK